MIIAEPPHHRFRFVTFVAALLTATACTAQRPHPTPPRPSTDLPSTRATSLGTLVGQVKYYGGPAVVPTAGGTPRMALEGAPGRGVPVIVSLGGRHIASVTTGRDGRFEFALEAGRYLLSTGPTSGCPVATVLVRAGARTQHDVICNVP